ncbi:MAG: DMT family transporter [Prevotella sp.]|jgi:drug/metabolite transporter (DMT)-like permease|nr:DMT family transporter [Prevotella sp.]MCH3993586.1 DMT family transporter [Prevotella sp.]
MEKERNKQGEREENESVKVAGQSENGGKEPTSKKDNSIIFAHLVAVITVACWGCTFVNTKYLLRDGLEPQEIFIVRFLLAYLCIWWISPKKIFCESWTDELTMLVLGVTGGSMYFLSENTAVGLTYVNNVAFIVCTAPLITTCLAITFIKSIKASSLLIIGSLTALAGVGAVIFNGHFVLHLSPSGDLLALTAAICWSVYSLVMKKASLKYSSIFITRKVFFYGILTILPVFIFRHWTFPLSRFGETEVWANLLFLGVIASFLCFWSWNWVIRKIGALKSSNYIYLNPITTVMASALFLNEPLTTIACVGGILILIGVFLSNQAKDTV